MPKFKSASEARDWLRNRYAEQCQLFPVLALRVPESLYLRRNMSAAMRMTTGAEV